MELKFLENFQLVLYYMGTVSADLILIFLAFQIARKLLLFPQTEVYDWMKFSVCEREWRMETELSTSQVKYLCVHVAKTLQIWEAATQCSVLFTTRSNSSNFYLCIIYDGISLVAEVQDQIYNVLLVISCKCKLNKFYYNSKSLCLTNLNN